MDLRWWGSNPNRKWLHQHGHRPPFPVIVLNGIVLVGLLNSLILLGYPHGMGVLLGLVALTVAIGSSNRYLHGSVLPGSRHFIRIILPDTLLRSVSSMIHPMGIRIGPEAIRADRATLEAAVQSLSVVAEDPDNASLTLDPAFREEWRETMANIQSNSLSMDVLSEVAPVIGLPQNELCIHPEVDGGDRIRLEWGGWPIGLWPSRTGFIADMAANHLLITSVNTSSPSNPKTWRRRITGLRMLLESCPECQGALTEEVVHVDTCCGQIPVCRGFCSTCNHVLYEFETKAENGK